MIVEIEKRPADRPFMVPFVPLADFRTHEQQLLPRMRVHLVGDQPVEVALAVVAIACMSAFSLGAKGRGRGRVPANVPGSNPGAAHSNAPAGTPSACPDRDLGKDRVQDVGRSKQRA